MPTIAYTLLAVINTLTERTPTPMGMDVIGTDPKNKTGEYFRANVWSWHPIWDYCYSLAPQICGKVENAHSNDGDGLGADDAEALGFIVLAVCKNGSAKKYIKDTQAEMNALPDTPCPHCRATGTRQWFIKNGDEQTARPKYQFDIFKNILDRSSLPKYKVNKKNSDETEVEKECNGCGGTGKERPFETHYGFDLDHLKEFGNFLVNCGGFAIY